MKWTWAVRVPRNSAPSVARLRDALGIEVGEHDGELWLRGAALDETLGRRLAQLPGAFRFEVLPNQRLRLLGRSVPTDTLPATEWLPLRQFLQLEWAVSDSSLRPQPQLRRVPLTVRRGGALREPNLLLADSTSWRCYGETAPQARLERWRIALDERGNCLVHGAPLPPLPGRRFVEELGVALPAGWRFRPRVSAAVVRELLGLAPDDLALFDAEGGWERVRASDWVFARRSAIRLSIPQMTSPGAAP